MAYHDWIMEIKQNGNSKNSSDNKASLTSPHHRMVIMHCYFRAPRIGVLSFMIHLTHACSRHSSFCRNTGTSLINPL
jgi:hypothetical protein